MLGTTFFYYTYRIYRAAKQQTGSKQFVMVVGVTFIVSFLARCVFFLIILSVGFVSDIYMFIVLFLTEVMMMFFIQLQFNFKLFRLLEIYVKSTTSSKSGSGSGSLSVSQEIESQPFSSQN
jgi:magnesium-transporting ATPase (P-type)